MENKEFLETKAKEFLEHRFGKYYMGHPDTIKLNKIKTVLQTWIDKQSHERCWWFPEILTELTQILDIEMTKQPCLPSRKEFEEGCKRYQEEQYKCST